MVQSSSNRDHFESRVATWIAKVDSFLENNGVGDVCSALYNPSRYALLGSGKRLRPTLAMASAEVFSLNIEEMLPFACSLELVHAASLIHDDLPCIDNDDFRRGKPSCHKKFGEGITVIAGDYLIARAVSLIANALPLSDREKLDLIRLISDATEELCDGQALDLKSQFTTAPDQVSSIELKNELYSRHLKKTAALITTAIVGPAYLLSCNEQQNVIPSLRRYGHHLGVLFQIVDDILDQTGSSEEIGKIGKSDTRLGVITYVSLYGLDGALQLAKDESERALAALSDLPVDASLLEGFADKILSKIK